MPNTKILEAIEQILLELRGRDDIAAAALEESVRLKAGELVISMQDLLDVLTDHTRRLEALKNDHGALREDMRREVLRVRQDLEKLVRDFRAYEEANQLRDEKTLHALEGHMIPPALPPSIDDASDDDKP